jgi:hypothetical protein
MLALITRYFTENGEILRSLSRQLKFRRETRAAFLEKRANSPRNQLILRIPVCSLLILLVFSIICDLILRTVQGMLERRRNSTGEVEESGMQIPIRVSLFSGFRAIMGQKYFCKHSEHTDDEADVIQDQVSRHILLSAHGEL